MQLTNPLKELHRIFDELSESKVLARGYFKISEIPNDFSYKEFSTKGNTTNINSLNSVEIEGLNFYYDI